MLLNMNLFPTHISFYKDKNDNFLYLILCLTQQSKAKAKEDANLY